jgi:3-deoxy-D-manno-oct-2-ulosonic acid (Kdo) hydroxylase
LGGAAISPAIHGNLTPARQASISWINGSSRGAQLLAGVFVEGSPMMSPIERVDIEHWTREVDAATQQRAIEALEHGRVLFFPTLAFTLEAPERLFLSPSCADRRSKNLSFNPQTGVVRGNACKGPQQEALAAMMARYAAQTLGLVHSLLPQHRDPLNQALTSYRPIAVEGRVSSYKKDDRRLHIDAFPSRPTQGWRILRVFSNVHPTDAARLWQIGEPFEAFVAQFLPRVPPFWPGVSWLLERLQITRGRRTPYDHLMLALHDLAKGDEAYQRTAPRVDIAFPPGSTWMAYTDRVLHAVRAGQYLFEQTFHLPVTVMREPHHAPLRILEAACGRPLS